MPHFIEEAEIPLDARLTLKSSRHGVAVLEKRIQASSERGQLFGMEGFVKRLVQSILIGGNAVVESVPGLGKTKACSIAAEELGLVFRRGQCTPDLLPSDFTVSQQLIVRDDGKAELVPIYGPVFANVVLIDEINRTTPKTQSGLLEAAEERQVTLFSEGGKQILVRPMDPPEADLLANYGPFFNVARYDPTKRDGLVQTMFATMNPIELEGTYPLSEAQQDRFLFKLILHFPNRNVTEQIMKKALLPPGDSRPHSAEEHVKTLYFISETRKLLFGQPTIDYIFGNKQGDPRGGLRNKVLLLLDYLHARRRPSAEDGSEGFGLPPSEIAERLAGELATNAALAEDTPERKFARHMQGKEVLSDRDYPEIVAGPSPRGAESIIRAAIAEAFFNGKFEDDTVKPDWEDFCEVAPDVLRHRITLSPGSRALGHSPDTVIERVIGAINTAF